MKKAGKKLYYKIGEVCEICGVEPHVLRYWEGEFPTLAPAKNRAGQRIYREKDLEMVEKIRQLLQQEGYTIAGARRKLAHAGSGDGLPLFADTSRVARKRALAEMREDLDEIVRLLDDAERR